jgi:glycosyltransferase involved in cell wall biosynthesis
LIENNFEISEKHYTGVDASYSMKEYRNLNCLVCVSHLRWEFVWQRPQHLLSRLAQNFQVVLVEEPVTSTDILEPELSFLPVRKVKNVKVVRLLVPAKDHYWIGHGDPATSDIYMKLLKNWFEENGLEPSVLWLYTPMALDFVEEIKHQTLVYDVMDQLSAFKGAPRELRDRERALLKKADLVFTGGASLYRDKLPYNPETYLFPSGVDVKHFGTAADHEDFDTPVDLKGLRKPLLGYYGVIDERMDLDLIAEVARMRPDWEIVLLGPVIKIEPGDLPQAPNLHYPGMKNYDELPAYLSRFDVALIPFALNEATKYLSPTKTLEYMAAHKPIVSTPIRDVVELYGDVVKIAGTPAEFCACIDEALKEDPAARLPKELELLEQHGWDNIVEEMNQLISARLPVTRP